MKNNYVHINTIIGDQRLTNLNNTRSGLFKTVLFLMKKILILILIFTSTLVFSQTKNVLFVGNSYTYINNMPQMVSDLAASVGDQLTFSTSAISSYSLLEHSTNTATLNLIRQGGWDYVILQEYSQWPSQSIDFVEQNVYPYAQYLDSEIHKYSPTAQTIFYMTWGRRDGDESRCSYYPEVCTYIGMDDLTRERYMSMAETNHALISPVGPVWRYIRENYPTIELYIADGSHPSVAGSYAAACSFYTAIFKKDPTQLTYKSSLNSSDAKKIRSATKFVVYDSLLTWHIGEYDQDKQSPTVPTGLTANSIGETSFTLTWAASSDNVGVVEYEVYQNGTLKSTVAGTYANITGLSASTSYSMTVKAKDAAGNSSSLSNGLNVTTDNHSTKILNVIGVTANNKIYNGTTVATLNTGSATLVGVSGGDVITLISKDATGAFANKRVGTGKKVTISGLILGGTDSGNYTLTQPSVTADITKASLTVTGVTANNKVYDGTTLATLNRGSVTLAGVFGSDVVDLLSSSAGGTFGNKQAGTGKTVSSTGFSISGSDAGNYTLIQPVLIANISPKAATIIANNLTKPYGTILTFTGTEFTAEGLVPGDAFSSIIISSTGAAASSAVATYPISIGGGSDSNYNFSYVSGILTISKSRLIATADAKTRVYGSDNPVLTISYTGFITGENAAVLDVTPVASTTAVNTSDAGTYAITLTGGSDNNYDLTLVDGFLKIEKTPLTITAEDQTRVYGGANPALGIIYSGFVHGDDQRVLDRQPEIETDADINSDAGTYDINVSGASDSIYSFNYNKGKLTVTKADQLITFAEIPGQLRMTQENRLSATASSGLAVSFEISDAKIGRLDGNILLINKEGHLTVRASQQGNHNWNPAPDVTQSIVTLPTFDGISSLFTPNNDGMNDYWYIPDLEQYGKLQVTVYNRFGQTVYRSDSYKNDWDGSWKGYPLPSASYYYIIKSSAKGFIKGVVNIVR